MNFRIVNKIINTVKNAAEQFTMAYLACHVLSLDGILPKDLETQFNQWESVTALCNSSDSSVNK